mmetsp:Transcript_58403/g.190494  ORF Transcript_58403/g.190494 Transcript_58403/m.190494 type:complete len:611 (+) Transcript_58403:117-1949(+)|eukprot:CAMPEP_0203869906 /NCGR_PEP_ID=MMETSP0359-20131031/17967_1 /ASSEMBLY_ACC=CAM_ASM_000338 /TAXON_ID=268821 /ORGANISM="Scrippsiella Hangoei, Strain SHTV-5" /LENGTH=610 /DNA_ID=CAMNT_0050788569 /DNA_START=109 /DNA_END=1941 /DNA_ORIENTATION=+
MALPELEESGSSSGEGSSSGSSSGEESEGPASRTRCYCCSDAQRKPAHVPKDSPFFHCACFQRAVALILTMGCIALVGSFLLKLNSWVGTAVLSTGPAFVIISYFYARHRVSTTARQIWVTFCEAALWMVPLALVIGEVDTWNDWFSLKDVDVSCSWAVDGGGEHLLKYLSWSANCADLAQQQPSGEPDGSGEHGAYFASWFGKLCPDTRAAAQEMVSEQGGLSGAMLKWVGNSTLHAADTLQCTALEELMLDVAGDIRVTSAAWDGKNVTISNRTDLAQAYEAIFGAIPSLFMSGDVEIGFRARPTTVLHVFITAFLRAGFLEELLKYVAVRRILFKDRVVDCGGVSVYGLAAGAGFATIENIQYALSFGAEVTYVRMIFSIPLHCCTGLIIGTYLGYRKFLGWKCYCLMTLLAPVFWHGLYDFVLMFPDSYQTFAEFKTILAFIVLVGSFVYARCAWLVLDNVCVVDVRSMMAAGLVSKPQFCCIECDCCSYFRHQDMVLQQRSDEVLQRQQVHQLEQQAARQHSEGSGGSESSPDMVMRRSTTSVLARQVTEALMPTVPDCQTTETVCPGCDSGVRAHILYPSSCPHCGTVMPDEVRLGFGSAGAAA